MPQKKGKKRKPSGSDEDQEVIFNLPPNAKKMKVSPPDTPPPPPNKNEPAPEAGHGPRRSPNGYILPDQLPEGMVVTDLLEQKWRLGKSIGVGGFGEIYSAALLNGNKASKEDYVVKVEPHTNGPLFVEAHFYCKAAKLEKINDFMGLKRLTHLGIPDLKGLGSFRYQNKKLRFLVMPRYGVDLQNTLDQSKANLSVEAASHIATQIVDCYEYLHSQGYVHKDLKGANVLFSRDKNEQSENKVYLVDYGLTSRYKQQGLHKPFEPDQRSAHEGTLEYISRDMHLGCVSRRGDIEVLLYVLIDWLGGHLSWDLEHPLKPTQIQDMKIEAFYDVKGFLANTFKECSYPTFLEDIMNLVKQMRFEEAPDYNYLRSLFRPYFHYKNTSERSERRISICEEHNNNYLADEDDDEVTISRPLMRKPSKRRTLPLNVKRQNSTSQPWTEAQMEIYYGEKNERIRAICEESLINPTPAILQQLAHMQKRAKGTNLVTTGTTRRKGVVAKRRLSRPAQQGGNNNDGNPPARRIATPVRKIATPLRRIATPFRRDVTPPRRIRTRSGEPITEEDLPTLELPRKRRASREIAPVIRKSPRNTNKKPGGFRQHFYGSIVTPLSNLVKTMFQPLLSQE